MYTDIPKTAPTPHSPGAFTKKETENSCRAVSCNRSAKLANRMGSARSGCVMGYEEDVCGHATDVSDFFGV